MGNNPGGINRREALAGTAAIATVTMAGNGSASAATSADPTCVSGPRVFPPPATISKAAQHYLSKGASQGAPARIPAVKDLDAWRDYIVKGNATLPVEMILKIPGFAVETREFGSATCHVVTPQNMLRADRRKAHLSIHGGGWILFGGNHAKALGILTAMQFGGVTYAVDYRMPPKDAFPAGLNDCFEVYCAMLQSFPAANILVSGESAGGNLAAALMLKLRDAKQEKPAALVLNTPVTDLTNAGDSWKVLYGLDPVLRDPDGVGSTELYLNGNDPREPYLSPLFGDLGAAFPPTHLTSGTRDRLLSDTVRMHAALRAAGVEADLYIAEAMPHAGFGQVTVEDQALRNDTRKWLKGLWPSDLRGRRSAGRSAPTQ